MSNKTISLLLIILAILVLSSCSMKNNINTNETRNNIEKTPKSNLESETCADCGQGGWQKMEVGCGQEILNKNDFKKCLMNFSWSSVNNKTDVENIKEGYIKMGGMETFNNPTADSIKVYIFNQWSADKDGNLYLLGQLG
jgi:hypothetical protein